MLTKVILDGKFGEVAGRREWMIECNSAAEAIQIIAANRPALKKWVRENLDKYKICEVEAESVNGNVEKLVTENFQIERKCKSIRFLPIFCGEGGKKGGLMSTIAGVVLIVIGAIMIACENPYGGDVILAGVAMLVGGICTMLIKTSKDEDDSGTSYFFNGAVNTVKQGMPVPLVFGRCRAGSAVISSSIEISDK